MNDDITVGLSEMGLRSTPQRLEIIQLLREMKELHPSLKSLYEKVHERMSTVSFSTLFNTITTLEKMGYLRIFDLEGETRVELNPDNHINIIDRRSGTIRDIADEGRFSRVMELLGDIGTKDRKVLINVIVYE
jgi:Fur family peroxide stress response transcriptional regulator